MMNTKYCPNLTKTTWFLLLPILKLSISEIVLFRCKGLSDDQLYHAPVGDTLHHPLLADHHGLRPVSHLDHLRPHAPFPPHHLVNQRLRPSIRQLFWYQQASTLIRISNQDCLFWHQWYPTNSLPWLLFHFLYSDFELSKDFEGDDLYSDLNLSFRWKEWLILKWSWKVMQRWSRESCKTIQKNFSNPFNNKSSLWPHKWDAAAYVPPKNFGLLSQHWVA